MINYQFWDAPNSGEVFAIRIEDGIVTGCDGPLDHSQVIEADLPLMHYDDCPEDAAWAESTRDDWRLHEIDIYI